MTEIKTIGIIGAGKLGVTVAQLALAAGCEVYIAGSGDSSKIELSTKIITPGAVAVETAEAVRRADAVILALPLGKFRSLDPQLFDGKLVIDSMNHWFEVDGPLEDIIPEGKTTSETVQDYLPSAQVVKAINHMGYHNLRDEARPPGTPGRKAIAVASDDSAAAQQAAELVDKLGFDPLVIGTLKDSRALESGQLAFGANLPRTKLETLLAQ